MRNPTFADILISHGSLGLKLIKLADYIVGGLIALLLFPQKNVSFLKDKFKNILIIRPGGMGDAVFLLPILRKLKDKGLNIDVLCEARNEGVFASQGYPAYVYTNIDDLREIASRRYDMVVDSEQWHFLSGILAYVINTDYRVGFASRSLRGKLFNKRIAYDLNAYELDNFIRLFEGVLDHAEVSTLTDIGHSFVVPSDARYWAELQLSNKEAVAIALGGSIALRRFSYEQARRFILQINAKGMLPVLLGGEDVKGQAQRLMTEASCPVLDYTGKITLIQSAAILERVRRLITPDTGLMHLACALGTPVTAVFGPGHVAKWRPNKKEHTVIFKELSCSPCTRFGYTCPTCEGAYPCLEKEGYAVSL